VSPPCFLVVDVETLGYAPTDALIELGWHSVEPVPAPPPETGYNYRYGSMTGQCLFGTGGQVMSADNRAVHHIDPAELEGLDLFDAAEWTVGLNDTTHLVAHNAEFEKQWLSPWGLPWICTYKCALHAFPDAPSHSNQALKYHLGMPDRPELHPPHRALPDAKVTAYLLTRLLDRYPIEQLLEWTNQPKLVLKLPFGKHKGMLIADAPGDYLDWVAGPRCEAAEEDLKFACRMELERRRKT
jgi:exodeoxyribonuclease X